jgi:hypothetical protein
MARLTRDKGFSLESWDFYGDFGRFSDIILPIFEGAIDEYLKEETPFYHYIPLIDCFDEKERRDPNRPLKLAWSFGLNEDRDAYVYETSVDERVALEFEMHRINDGRGNRYTMTSAQVENFKLFATALRELADKIDVELTKTDVEPEKGEDDGN